MLVSRMTYLVLVTAVANARRKGTCYNTKGLCGPGVTDVKQNYNTFKKEAKKYGISVDIDYEMLSGSAVAYGIQTLAPVYMALTNDDTVGKLNTALSKLQATYSKIKDKKLRAIMEKLADTLDREFDRLVKSSVDPSARLDRISIKEAMETTFQAIPDLTLHQFNILRLQPTLKEVANDLGRRLDDFMDDVTYNFAGGDDRKTALLDAYKWVWIIDQKAHKSAIVNYPQGGFLPHYRRVHRIFREIESRLKKQLPR